MEDIEMEHPKFIEFQGKKYRLSTGNYYRAENWGKGVCNLHRAIWEFHHKCKIPDGHDVHHIDDNRFNNDISNLELIHGSDHARYHLKKRLDAGTLDNEVSLLLAREAAKSWHSSPEGRAWHGVHGKETWKDRGLFTVTCQNCGITVQTPFPTRKAFCGPNCRNQARYHSGIDNIQRACVICGKDFTTNRFRKIKTCSKNCANISMLKNRKRL
jgi:hypothetical protein